MNQQVLKSLFLFLFYITLVKSSLAQSDNNYNSATLLIGEFNWNLIEKKNKIIFHEFNGIVNVEYEHRSKSKHNLPISNSSIIDDITTFDPETLDAYISLSTLEIDTLVLTNCLDSINLKNRSEIKLLNHKNEEMKIYGYKHVSLNINNNVVSQGFRVFNENSYSHASIKKRIKIEGVISKIVITRIYYLDNDSDELKMLETNLIINKNKNH